MKSTSLFTPSTTPVPKEVQVDIAAQLRSTMFVLRDLLFNVQETSTLLGDIIHDIHALVLKVEAALVQPDCEVGHGQ